MVTGGNSCLQGFSERLNRDLASKTPPVSIIIFFFSFFEGNAISCRYRLIDWTSFTEYETENN